jgi:hypothetical protein
MGSEPPRGWFGPTGAADQRIKGSMELIEYQPVSNSTVVSRFGPFTLHRYRQA